MRKFYLMLEKNINKLLEENNLTISQSFVLSLLNHYYDGSCEFKKIEKRLDVAQSTTVNLIKKLEQKGFVETFISKEDKRVKILKITEKGKGVCELFNEKAKLQGKKMYDNLTVEEKEQFFMLLQKISCVLD